MRSYTTKKFREMYAHLPEPVQVNARRAYQLFRRNPAHPSLNLKKVDEREGIYSARIGLSHRALGRLDGADMIWFWIGPHSQYDKLL